MKAIALRCLIPFLARFGWLVLPALVALPVAGAADLNGTWRLDIVKPWGITLHHHIVLRQEGRKVDAMMIINGAADEPLREIKMEGDEIIGRIDWDWNFRLRPDGPNLRVLIVYGHDYRYRDAGVAYPVPAGSGKPPAVLPVPALRDLPDNGLARTPPMGWNSWNHFGELVDDALVRETADAMVSSGMAAAGYTFVNIDDCWEAGRDANGNIVANEKFPNMKALADYVHAKGLKLGIYSSPGFVTCGGYPGSYGHEEQDARTYAAWGIDYLKYDWCSAGRLYEHKDLRPVYQKMGDALQRCGRPIVFSLCEYGAGDVWTWGPLVGGNLWRTTGDIHDNWKEMSEIGFSQSRLAPYAGPGHWNDPDMLEVGNGGMTNTEYRTHFSLWCLLAAPLMAGNDLRTMLPETREILTNREVIAVDQDSLGRQGSRVLENGGLEVWTKPLSDHRLAVGVFNRNQTEGTASFTWAQVGLAARPAGMRDLWQHADLPVGETGWSGSVPEHGVVMLVLK